MALVQIDCCGRDMRAMLIVDAQPWLAVLVCDACRRRRWFRDGAEITAEQALQTAAAADCSHRSAVVEAGC